MRTISKARYFTKFSSLLKQKKQKLQITLLISAAFMLLSPASNGQVSEIKLGDIASFGKFKKFDKKIYIAEFTVNYQVLYESRKSKQAGTFGVGGHYKSSSEAKGSLGLKDMSTQMLQKMTDDLYTRYINKLTENGFEILTAKQAANVSVFQNMKQGVGGEPYVGYPGTISCIPSGFTYFYNTGLKEKAEKFIDKTPSISKDLNDIIVAKVCLNVQFAQAGQQLIKYGSSVKMKTNLALVQNLTASEIAQPKGIGFKKNDLESISSHVTFMAGKKMASAEAAYNGTIKKDIKIEGVIKDEKVNAFASGNTIASGYQMVGTNYAILFYEKDVVKDLKEVEVDLPKYEQYVGEALNKVLMGHTDIFLSKL
ncbi:MAG: hypothetical protein ACK5M7_15595 [Draconibacterium sp.]